MRTHGLEGFGLEQHAAAIQAAGGLVSYLRDTQKADLAHVRAIAYKAAADSLTIDPITLKHLEVLSGSDGGASGSLLHEIDRTVTSMGGAAAARDGCCVRSARSSESASGSTRSKSSRFAPPSAAKVPRALQTGARRRAPRGRGSRLAPPAPAISCRCASRSTPSRACGCSCPTSQAPLLRSLLAELDDLADVRDLIERTLIDEPPAIARDGGFTRDGIDPELDELKTISRSGRQVIAEMEERERARTGIGSLKVRFNRVFGYYIEISKSNLHAVPADYQRKQTIAGGERFTTPALKEYEEKVLGADERILERELEIFESLRAAVAAEAPRMQDTARALAAIDVLAGLAETAAIANFTKPHVHDGDEFVATDVRHPVVERSSADPFVPNDIDLNGTSRQLVILTGPNMGGKSTYLRQTALIPLLAQIGSFVPARDAKLPIVDRIFARVGASDNIARGQSTFMVEMQETANILHTATSRSLVVLDEIGRGTSTFDGLSIAWAVAEHLATNARARPKTLFATHYHELTDLADALPGVVNAHVSAREWKDEIMFLRKIVPADRTAVMASRSRGWQDCRRPSSRAPGRSSAGSSETSCRAAGGPRSRAQPATVNRRSWHCSPGRPTQADDQVRRGSARDSGDRPRRDDAASGARAAGRTEEARGRHVERTCKRQNGNNDYFGQPGLNTRASYSGASRYRLFAFCILHFALLTMSCTAADAPASGTIVVGVRTAPNTLDPRFGNDETGERVSQLVFSSLMDLGDDLRVTPTLAERLDNPDPLTYIATLRQGVKFHDGHELTSKDVVFNYAHTSILTSSRHSRAPSRCWRRCARSMTIASSSR